MYQAIGLPASLHNETDVCRDTNRETMSVYDMYGRGNPSNILALSIINVPAFEILDNLNSLRIHPHKFYKQGFIFHCTRRHLND